MSKGKWALLAAYLLALVAALCYPGTVAALVAYWFFGTSVVVHLVEFLLKRPVLKAAGGSMANHFFQVMVFGILHWKPLAKAGE